MAYVDGFVVAVPKKNLDAYKKLSKLCGKVWREHGALDYRVPDNQGIAAFNVLQRRGIPSELLYFPDENHWVLKPANSILWHDTVLAWLDRWLKRGPHS